MDKELTLVKYSINTIGDNDEIIILDGAESEDNDDVRVDDFVTVDALHAADPAVVMDGIDGLMTSETTRGKKIKSAANPVRLFSGGIFFNYRPRISISIQVQ